MPKSKTEDLLLFVVPKAHWDATLSGCHRDAGHQGHDHTLSLLWEHSWWLVMINQMQPFIKSWMHCLQNEGNLPKVPLHPIVATCLLDLLHVDFTSIETTMELNQPARVTNVLVFQDHFTKHIMAYVSLWLNSKNSCQVPVSGLHLNLQGPGQAPKPSEC